MQIIHYPGNEVITVVKDYPCIRNHVPTTLLSGKTKHFLKEIAQAARMKTVQAKKHTRCLQHFSFHCSGGSRGGSMEPMEPPFCENTV